MTREEKSNKVECCVLIADVNNEPHYYNIPKQKIEESIKIIEIGFNNLNNPCSRIYIAGFNLINENDVLTKDKLIERLAYDGGKRKSSIK